MQTCGRASCSRPRFCCRSLRSPSRAASGHTAARSGGSRCSRRAAHRELPRADADQRRAVVRPVSRAPLALSAGYALTLVALTNAISLLDRNILAILAPRIKHDLAIGDAEMRLLYGPVFARFYALFSPPPGRLAHGRLR